MGEEEKRGASTEHASSTSLSIPSSVIQNRNVSILEAIAYYLKHKLKLTYHEIALLLNRNDRTIWTCVNRAGKKLEHQHTFQKKALHQVLLPSSILKNRNISPLEAVCVYLKEERGLSLHEIGQLLNRNDRTIWTCCHRAQIKRGDRK